VLSGYTSITLDILAAIPYLVHFPLPVLFIIYLVVSPQRRGGLYSFVWLAGWVNFLAVLFQFFVPCAPV
jgi:hypothetical protein